MLVLAISKDLDELFQDRRMAAITSLCKAGRVMVMTVDLSSMLIVTVLGSKNRSTRRTREVIDVILPIQSCDIGTTESAIAFVADQIEAPEIIRLAQRILTLTVLVIDWEEFRGNDFATVLELND